MKYIKKKRHGNIFTYQSDNFFLKKYYDWTEDYHEKHTDCLERIFPGYILEAGVEEDHVWKKYKVLPGIPALEFEHTEEFILKILNFCINNYHQTYPYAHMEWSLANMLVDDETVHLCDWDSLAIYPPKKVWKAMHNQCFDMFGPRIQDFFQNDFILADYER